MYSRNDASRRNDEAALQIVSGEYRAATRRIAVVAARERVGAEWERTLREGGYDAVLCSTNPLEIAAADPALVIIDAETAMASRLVHDLRALGPAGLLLLLRGTLDHVTPDAISAVDASVMHELDGSSFLDTVARLLGIMPSTSRTRVAAAFGGLIGTSPAMQRIYRLAAQVAPTRATVLITGESGTGKGALARAIHAQSPRASAPFVSVHCAALAETLLESELFGHEKGSFTGADRRRPGRFELSHGGTLLLDEVGEIPLATQVKLLRVLQEREFERVGGNQSVAVDVRIVAATNRDLAADVKSGRFREDLFYRLNVVQIEMPPLRMRTSDLMLLATHYLEVFCRENGKPIARFTPAARAQIMDYGWPGNVRELENAIERAVVVSEGSFIDTEDLPIENNRTSPVARIPGSTLAEIERFAITATLEAAGGSTARAAEILGVSVRTVQYRVQEYGIRGRRSD